MTDLFTTIIFAISPIILAGLLVAWVYRTHRLASGLRNDMIQNNQAIVQAFSELRGQIQALNPKEGNDASTSEAT
jgi:hypothetical protein